VPETTYNISIYVKSGTSGDESYSVMVYDASWNIVLNKTGTSSGSWVNVSGTFVNPAGSSDGYVFLLRNTPTAGTFFWDTVSITQVGTYRVNGSQIAQKDIVGLTTADGPTFAHLHLTDVAAITTAAESWVGPSSTTGVYFKGGNVGIGTTTPVTKLDVRGTSASGYGLVQIANTNVGGYPDGTDLLISSHPGNSSHYTSLAIYRSADQDGFVVIDAYIAGVGGATLALNAANGGKVGIGCADPAEKLDVTGNINVTGV
jgi:hypothetical protein